MATANINFMDHLQCSLCLDTYSDPKFLTCHHSFCKDCINDLLHFSDDGSAVIQCPECPETTFVNHLKTTNDLSPNFQMRGLVDAFVTNKRSDGLCNNKTCDNIFVNYCAECARCFCNTCSEIHKCDTTHSTFPVNGKSLRVLCSEHNTACSYMCCGKHRCIFCVKRNHRHHHYINLDDHIKGIRQNIHQEMERFQIFEKSLPTATGCIEATRQLFKDSIKQRKEKCISNYIEFVNTEEVNLQLKFDCVLQEYESYLNIANLKKLDELANNSDIQFSLLENMTARIQELSLKEINSVNVTLSDGKINNDHPLGEVVVERIPNPDVIYVKYSDPDMFKDRKDPTELLQQLGFIYHKASLTPVSGSSATAAIVINRLTPEELEEQRKCLEKLDAEGFNYMEKLIKEKKFREVRLITSSERCQELIGMRSCDDNETLLFCCARVDNVELMKSLIEVGLDVEWRDNIGWTFAHDASMYGSVNCLRHVCQHFPQLVDLQTNAGSTCLHYAVDNNHLSSVQLLLEYKADLGIKDKEGQTPLDLAKRKNYKEIIKELEKGM